ncbi:hypothetical protein RHMOL_Rhmol07G0085200 [Rhododendron molle]|uniref:Uncharacterized protein n=1 Tax=Rhododendron molle TaxID=49168 RepID=A0ACC0MYT0_RHOML|nr:hypothetical protein RHMOL_Rhmol07G0085200 [Rhododendron molle]
MAPPPFFHGGSRPPPPPPQPSSNPGQYIQQFLSNLLSQRGPSSLPYSEDSKWLIRQHLVTLSESYPSLAPKTALYTHADGRSSTLLQADGTVPILFHSATYNIPVVIWLLEPYPRRAPLVYVNPTRDMVIKRPHSFVDPSGLVSVPYLSNWVYPSSNLVDLARDLARHFARDPPLYSRRPPAPNANPSFASSNDSVSGRPNQSPNPTFALSNSSVSGRPNPNPTFASSNNSPSGWPDPNPNPSFASSGNSVSVRPAIPPRSYPQSPYGSGGPQVGTEDPAEVFKRNAVNKLVESLSSDIGVLRKTRGGEMEGVVSVQAALREREEQIGRGVREMQGEKEALEQQLQMVSMNTDVLEGWLRENGGKVKNVDVDDAFECCDVLSKQMTECTAADLAIEDVVYALDKAVQEGSIAFGQYLRNVRLLSREQFFHRATNSKVRAAQMGAQISSMAARASQLAV